VAFFLRAAPWLVLAGCLPSITFSQEAGDASGDGSSAEGAGADAADGHATDSGTDAADAAADSTTADSTGEDTGAEGSTGAGVTLDPGFPKTAQIDDTTGQSIAVTFDVAAPRLLVTVVVWGQHGGSSVWPVVVSGAGLSWTLRTEQVSAPEYVNAVGVGIWTAWAATAASAQTVTAQDSTNETTDALLAVYSFAGASQNLGAFGGNNAFDGGTPPLSISIEAQAAGSFLVGGLLDGLSATGLSGSPFSNTTYDVTLASASQDSLGICHVNTLTAAPGVVTFGQTASEQASVTAGLEILPQ
jgi:hypothetical protein